MSQVADLWVLLRANTAGFRAEMMKAGAEADAAMSTARKAVIGAGGIIAGGLAAVGYESLKMGANFQSSMQRINTLAMGGRGNIAQLGQSVLQLAGQVGYGPESLAEALYHIESNFYSVGLGGKQALDALKVAAQGAQIGGADLVDVTNALGAAVASGIPGVQNYSSAMKQLLDTVGSGDMTMQNLADAFSTGLLAIGKQYGATLTDMDAALATFGDNNIRGQKAATDLRMSIMDLTKQGKPGVAALQSIGIASGQLATDMQQGGMQKAIIDLRNHLQAAGITGARVGQVLEEAFTKRSSAPLAILMGQFDRLQSKYQVLTHSSQTFGQAWDDRLHTLQQQVDNTKARFESWLTDLGVRLMPVATAALADLNKAFDWLGQHQDAVAAIAGAVAGLLVPAITAAVMAFASFAAEAAPFVLVGAAIAVLWEKCRTFRTVVESVFGWVAHTAFPWLTQAAQAAMNGAAAAFQWFQDGPLKWIQARLAEFGVWWQQHAAEVEQIVSALWKVVGAEFKIGVDLIKQALSVGVAEVKYAWNLISSIVTFQIHLVESTIAVVLDVLTGHWSQAWHDLTSGVSTAFHDILNVINNLFGGLPAKMLQIGEQIVSGLIHGITNMVGSAVNTAKNLAGSVVGAVTGHLKIFSPSRVFHDIGLRIGDGLVAGMDASHANVVAAAGRLASATGITTSSSHKPSYVGHHKYLTGLQDELSKIYQQLTHDRTSIRADVTARTKALRGEGLYDPAHVKALQKAELARYAILETHERRLMQLAQQRRRQIDNDPHATSGERKRASEQVAMIHRQMLQAGKLRQQLLDMVTKIHTTQASAARARKESAKMAVQEDLPTYLSVAAAAGMTSYRPSSTQVAVGLTAPATAAAATTVVLHTTVMMDGQKVAHHVQKHALRHERRNTSNGYSARRANQR